MPPHRRRVQPTIQTAHLETETLVQSSSSPLEPILPWPPVPVASPLPQPAAREYGSAQRSFGRDQLPLAKEVYGAIAVLLTYLGFALYLVWALVPARWLEHESWAWLPSQQWTLIVPCYLMVCVWLAYWSYAGLTAYLTPPFDSMDLITDKFARLPEIDADGSRFYWKYAGPSKKYAAVDLPVDLVNRVLYPPRARPALQEYPT